MAKNPKSYEPFFWRDPAYLKKFREGLDISQEALARESGVTRGVIANYETGVTNLSSVDTALKLYRVLAAKERTQVSNLSSLRDAPQIGGALKAVLALLALEKESAKREIAEIGRQAEMLQRKMAAVKARRTDIETEELYWKGPV